MANENRTVKVSLEIGVNPGGESALKSLEKSLIQLGEAAGKASGGGGAKGGSSGGGFSQGIKQSLSGNFGGAAESFGAGGIAKGAGFAAAGVVANAGFNAATRGIHDKYSTSGQIGRGFLQDIPGGGFVLGKVDALTGREYKMEQAHIDSQMRQSGINARSQTRQFELGYNPEMAGLAARSSAFGGSSAITMPYINRSTAAGSQEFQEQSRLLPIKREIAKAERETLVASAERRATQTELNKLTSTESDLKKRSLQLESQVRGDNSSGPERERLLLRQADTESELVKTVELRRAAVMSNRIAKMRESDAIGEGIKKSAQLQIGEAENLEARADKGAAQFSMLGSQNAYQQQWGLASAQMLKESDNPANLPEEVRSQAQQYAPSLYRQKVQAAGENSPLVSQLREISPEDYHDVESNRKQSAGLRQSAAETEFGADARIAKAAASAGGSIGSEVLKAIDSIKESANRTIINGIRQARNK